MTQQHPDDDLRRLLADAVDDVAPHDRLGEIRRRTSQPPRRASRRLPLAVLGAGVATAAVVGGVAWVSGLGLRGDDAPVTSAPAQEVVATYFAAETPVGTRLFREFQSVPEGDTPLPLAALRLLESDAGPHDPDYTTAWPDGSFLGVEVTDELIEIRLADRVDPLPAEPAAQQAVFTVQAALGTTLPVAFTTPEGTLAVEGEASVRRDNTVLAPVNVSDPVEGHTVDDLLTVRGVVTPSGTAPVSVSWELQAADRTAVASGSAPVDGRAWEETRDISSVPSGTYTLVAAVATPRGEATDTRTVTVR